MSLVQTLCVRLSVVVVVAVVCAMGAWAPPEALAAEVHPAGWAAPASAAVDPFEAIRTKVENVATGIAKLSTPVAILGIVLVLLMILFAPLLPEVAQQHKGYIIRALLITAVISIIPELVKAFSTLGA
jgi:hypothetical protein